MIFSKVSWNLLIFVIIQSVFFYTISSDFVLGIVTHKAERLGKIIVDQVPTGVEEEDTGIPAGIVPVDFPGSSDAFLGEMQQNLEEREVELEVEAEIEKEARNVKNRDLILARMAPWFGAGLLALLVSTSLAFGGGEFGVAVWPELTVYAIILLSYATEISLFFLMLKRYEYIGTFEILKVVNDQLPPQEFGVLGRQLR